MNNDDVKTLMEWKQKQSAFQSLKVIVNSDKRSVLFQQFAESLSEIIPEMDITIKKDTDSKEPYIEITENIYFKSVPQGKLLKSFLSLISTYNNDFNDTVQYDLNINTPLYLDLYISPYCAYCPSVLNTIGPLSIYHKNVYLSVIDGSLFNELAESVNITSAPTLVFDDRFRWTGAVTFQEVLEVITTQKPEDLSSNALKAMIETGKASTLAEMMITENKIFPNFFTLLTHDKWPVRLGAMVVLEEISDNNTYMAESIIKFLVNHFEEYDTAVQGDIIYMTGESGTEKDMNMIQQLITDNPTDEIAEAVEEALIRLSERQA